MFHDEPCQGRRVMVEHATTLCVTEQASVRPSSSSHSNRIGYASTLSDPSDVREAVRELQSLGVKSANIYIDHATSGRGGERPVRKEALAACTPGDHLVAASFVRLARSLGDLDRLVRALHAKDVQVMVAGQSLPGLDPTELLTMVSSFEADLIDVTLAEDEWAREDRRKQDLRASHRTLTALQEQHLRQVFDTRRYRAPEIGEMFGISRASVFRLGGRSPGPLTPSDHPRSKG